MQRTIFDVVIVGSGAAGGTLAAHLATRGARVAIVEGGPRVNTRTDFNTHAMPFDFPNRHIPTMRPGKPGFDSERTRGVGGKTMLWNAVALRFSQRDFKGRSADGAGEDWPIDYADLAPYYDTIEREVGVCGNLDHLEDLPDGIFLPPVPMKCSDLIVQRGARKLGADRRFTCARPRCRGRRRPALPATSAATAWPAATWSRSTTLRTCTSRRPRRPAASRSSATRSSARCWSRRTTGRPASGSSIACTSAMARCSGRCVVVACGCVQSVALLLMSTSSRYPTGLANSSGALGRHFIPHFTGGIECFLKELSRHAGDERRGLPRSRLSALVHAHSGSATTRAASARSSTTRTAAASAGPGRSAGSARPTRRRSSGRIRPSCSLHALRRDAAERAVVRRSRLRAARRLRAAAGAPAGPLGGERAQAVRRHGELEPGDAGAGRCGDPVGSRRAGDEPRTGRLPDGQRSANRRW